MPITSKQLAQMFVLLLSTTGSIRADGPEWKHVQIATMYYMGKKDSPCLMSIYHDRAVLMNEKNETTHALFLTRALLQPGLMDQINTLDWRQQAYLTGQAGSRVLVWGKGIKWTERAEDDKDARKVIYRMAASDLLKYLPKDKEPISFKQGSLTFMAFPGHKDSHIRLVTGGVLIRGYFDFPKPIDKRGYTLIFVPISMRNGKFVVNDIKLLHLEIRDFWLAAANVFGANIPGKVADEINKDIRGKFENQLNSQLADIVKKHGPKPMQKVKDKLSARCENEEVVIFGP